MHLCPYCDYDLKGLPEVDRCPECGNIVSIDYLNSLMQHRFAKDEQMLYKIALVGWSAHPFLLLFFGPLTPTAFGLMFAACVPAGALVLCTTLMAHQARKSWPRRYALIREDTNRAAPRGLLWALLSWALPSIILCGLVAGL